MNPNSRRASYSSYPRTSCSSDNATPPPSPGPELSPLGTYFHPTMPTVSPGRDNTALAARLEAMRKSKEKWGKGVQQERSERQESWFRRAGVTAPVGNAGINATVPTSHERLVQTDQYQRRQEARDNRNQPQQLPLPSQGPLPSQVPAPSPPTNLLSVRDQASMLVARLQKCEERVAEL
jgi:hypothetical protein